MSRAGYRYACEAILLVAVVVPLATAEQVWWYGAVTAAAVVIGWWRTVRADQPLLGPATGQLFVVAAAGLLVFEYGWVDETPAVLALAHFMILVCVSKLLQRRTLRDDAHLLVLTLLLLVVVAVVSGNLGFPLVLVIFATVGVDTLTRFYLDIEAARVDARNRAIRGSAPARARASEPSGQTMWAVTGLIGSTAMAVGVAVFLLFPRVGAGMLGRFDTRAAAGSVTGFAQSLSFRGVGPVRESQRPVMRVVVEYEDGRSAPRGQPLYFRGVALEQYRRRGPARRASWSWGRTERSGVDSKNFRLRAGYAGEQSTWLFAEEPEGRDWPAMVQHYYMEPGERPCLFTCYPAVEVASKDIEEIHKYVPDQVLHPNGQPDGPMAYTVRTPITVAGEVADLLAAERTARRRPGADAAEAEPPALQPDPPLPDEERIRALIARETRGIDPHADPGQRRAFVQALVSFLRSPRFIYTLNPPRTAPGDEPVGRFLLSSRRGHCEYFASALAVMCHLSGIPARVVNGYLTGDYNPVGDFYLVREKHAHSWVEVFIPGEDWVTFDPTPASPRGSSGGYRWLLGLARYVDYLQFQWAHLVLAYDAEVRKSLLARLEAWLMRPAQDEHTLLGAVAAFVRELFGWRLKLAPWERLVYWVFTLLVVTLVSLVGYVVTVVAWRILVGLTRRWHTRVAFRSREGKTEFYDRFRRRLAALGFHRRPDQTPAEFAAELAATSPAFAEAPELVRAYYEVVFGDRELAPARRLGLEAFLRQLRQTDLATIQQAGLENPPGT